MEDHYASYLLRLCRFEREGQTTWRAWLECTRTGEQACFTLEELCAFLEERFGPAASRSPGETSPGETLPPLECRPDSFG